MRFVFQSFSAVHAYNLLCLERIFFVQTLLEHSKINPLYL